MRYFSRRTTLHDIAFCDVILVGITKVPGLALMFAPAQDQHGNSIPLPGPNEIPQFVAVSYTGTVTFQNLNMFCLQHAYHRQPYLFELIEDGEMRGVRKLTQEEIQQRLASSSSSDSNTSVQVCDTSDVHYTTT
jgi:hypothetical protein